MKIKKARRGITRWRHAALTAAASAVAMASGRSARAIDIRDDVPDSKYTALAAESQYASSGYIDVQPGGNPLFASATLIAPDWVITAGHAVTFAGTTSTYNPSFITFGQGATTTAGQTASNSVTRVVINPGFTGNVIDGSDFALLQLATPITNIAPAVVYMSSLGSESGQTVTVVGYGETGTGLTGEQGIGTLGTRRAMQNTIDAFGGQITTGGLGGTNTYDFTSVSSNVMLLDFDSPSNPFAGVMGGTTPLGLEGATVDGDSGGGAFLTVNGKTYLAGVTSFIGAFSDNPYSTNDDGHYGDFDGYGRLSTSSAANFLISVLVTNSTWSQPFGGSWAGVSNWSGSNIPEYMTSTATFNSGTSSATTITLDANWTVGTVTFNNTNSYTLTPGTASVSGSLTLDNGTSPALINNLHGSHFITAPLNLISALKVTSTFSTDVLTLSGKISGIVPLTVSGPGTLRFAAGVSTPTFTSLIINTGSTLDITTNAVAINFASPAADPIGTIAGYLASGYNSGKWTGTGIASSTAAAGSTPALSVGYADGNIDAGTSAASNQVLVRYTLAGDANLDGLVNFADLLVVVQNFNKPATDWSQGNFEFGTSTNFADLLLVAQNFNKILAPVFTAADHLPNNSQPLEFSTTLHVSNTSVQLPEPAGALPVLFSAALLAGQRSISRSRKKAPGGLFPRLVR